MSDLPDSSGMDLSGVLAYTYPEHIPDFLETGIRVFRFSVSLGWKGPGIYDYADGDEIIAAFCAAGPEVRLFPMIWLDGPETKWWELEYPDEVARMRDRKTGEICDEAPFVSAYAKPGVDYTPKGDLFDRLHQGVPCLHSFASEVWLSQVTDALRLALGHYEKQFPGRFAGFYLCAGLSHEWFNWGNYTDDVLFDYSRPMRNYFQGWVAGHYGTPQDLSKAWGQNITAWESVDLPMPAGRPSAGGGAIPDPAIHAPAADFAAALADAQADCFLHLCGVARASTAHGTLVGGFYGYWWTQTDFPSPARNGHLALQRVLESPDVDFIASPFDYSNRGVGGATSSQSMTGSASWHGKRFINSADVKLSQEKHGWWHSFIQVPENPSEAIELLKRDFGFSMAEGLWHSWVDLFGGSFSRQDVRDALRALQSIAATNPALRQVPKAEALVVVDELSLRQTTPNNGLWTILFPVQKQWNLHRSGFPWTFITLEDFLQRDWPDLRLANFLNVFVADEARREAIHEKLRAARATAIWNLYPGLLGDSSFDLRRAEALTGFSLAQMGDSQGDWDFCPTGKACAMGAPAEYGTSFLRECCSLRMKHYPSPDQLAGSPRLEVVPHDADEPLAKWADASGIGLARTERPGFTSIFNAGPLLPDTLLNAFARASNVHCFAPAGDLVYANDRFLCLSTGPARSRVVRLRESTRATDLWNGNRTLGSGSVTVEAAPNTTFLLGLEPSSKDDADPGNLIM
ncbi:MAG: hypothetical protein WCH98_08485 [Verrucomicrobiota bacterium]